MWENNKYSSEEIFEYYYKCGKNLCREEAGFFFSREIRECVCALGRGEKCLFFFSELDF